MNANPAPSDRGRKTVIVLLAAALVAAAVWIAILLMQQVGGRGQNGPGTTPTAETSTTPSSPGPSATSTAPSPTASASDLPGTLPAAEAAMVVWPDPAGTLRYGNPEDAAEGFAEEFAGFTDPVYGAFMQGDARSGELEVRATTDGAVTTVLLRQLSDGQWYAIGAISSEIQLDVPAAGARISAPVALSGSSRAFEATVNVEVRSHGTAEPLGSGIVMGGAGPELGPFSGSIQWDNPGNGSGALLLFVSSAKDGSVWTATAVPIGFAAQP